MEDRTPENELEEAYRERELTPEEARREFSRLKERLSYILKEENQIADLKRQLAEERERADALAEVLEDTNNALGGAKAEAECLGRELDRLEADGCHVTCLLDDEAMDAHEEQIKRSHSALTAYRKHRSRENE